MAETEKKLASKSNQWPRRSKGGGKKACSVQGCQRPYRAKWYCFFHYKKWRQGELPHSRYRVCSKPECRAKTVQHGLCAKHLAEAPKEQAAGTVAPASAAPPETPAPPAAPAAPAA